MRRLKFLFAFALLAGLTVSIVLIVLARGPLPPAETKNELMSESAGDLVLAQNPLPPGETKNEVMNEDGEDPVLAQNPLPPDETKNELMSEDGEDPVSAQDPLRAALAKSRPPLTLTAEMIKQAEVQAKQHLSLTGEQVSLGSTWGDTTYWFSVSWSTGNSIVQDYEVWNFFKINGQSDLFYVEEVGSAYTKNADYALTRFEPWIASGTSNARLISWDPSNQVNITDESIKVGFSLGYEGTGVSTEFYPTKDTYNPYAWATHYSLEWRGWKSPNNTVGVNYVTRWSDGEPWGMQLAACGRGNIWWGCCSDR